MFVQKRSQMTQLNPEWFKSREIEPAWIRLGPNGQVVHDGCRVKDWQFRLGINTTRDWTDCGFQRKLTLDGEKLIYENQLRIRDQVGDAVVGQQIDIRISCTYDLTTQLRETYQVAQEYELHS